MSQKQTKNRNSAINQLRSFIREQVEEHIIRTTVRKLVHQSLTEAKEEESKDLVSVTDAVFDFFDKNKKKLEKLADEEEWDDFYELGFEKFPEADQDDVAQAMNKAAMRAGWFENEIEDYRQSEKELDMMANGTKEQQKGVKMGDYDKKMKTPKASPTELKPEELKKLKTESLKKKKS